MYYLLSEASVFGVDANFPGAFDASNVKFRAVVWAGAQFFLWTAVLVNFIHRESTFGIGQSFVY